MQITMTRNMFGSDRTLYASGNTYTVADSLAFEWIGIGAAVDVGTGREDQQGTNQSPVSGGGTPETTAAIFGDSRAALGYLQFTPSAVTVTGLSIAITATGIGAHILGDKILLGGSWKCEFILASVTSVVDANNIVATATFPTQLPQGTLLQAGCNVLIRSSLPQNGEAAIAWALAYAAHPHAVVRPYCYSGARVRSVLAQVAAAVKEGQFDVAYVNVGYNSYATAADNLSVSDTMEHIKAVWGSLRGKKIRHFLETPVAAANGNASKIVALNAALVAAANSYNVTLIDVYTPMVSSTPGVATAENVKTDGIHPSNKAAMINGAALASVGIIPLGDLRVLDANNAIQPQRPSLNPTMAGTLGASVLPTNFTQAVSAGGVITSFALLAPESGGFSNIFTHTCTAISGNGLNLTTQTMTVVAGQKYRARVRVKAENIVGGDFFGLFLLSGAGAVLDRIWRQQSATNASDISGNTGWFWMVGEFVVPVGNTTIQLRARLDFDANGGGTVSYSDFDIEAV